MYIPYTHIYVASALTHTFLHTYIFVREQVPCGAGAWNRSAPCRESDGFTPAYLSQLVAEFHRRGMSEKLVFLGHDEPHSPADFAAVRAQASFVRKAEAEVSWPSGARLGLTTTTDIGTADQMNSSGAVSTYVLRQSFRRIIIIHSLHAIFYDHILID
jgi:hypothetical protein